MHATAERLDTILVVDDDATTRGLVATALSDCGYHILEAATGAGAVAMAATFRPELIVLDVELGDMNGADVCRELRRFNDVPIIALSAHHGEQEKIGLLHAGADDYVTKPLSIGEFAARIAAQLRRVREYCGRASKTPLAVGDLRIDFHLRRVTRGGRVVSLTPVEWKLLAALAAEPGRVISHREIFEAVWGHSFSQRASHLRVHITHLRRKLERSPATPAIIVTEPGVGYRLELLAGVT